MRTADFDYHLPPDLIAQSPLPNRDASKLLVLSRRPTSLHHAHIRDLPTLLRPTDLLILNDSRVIPARLRGHKIPTGGSIEALLLEENRVNDWWAMLKPGSRIRAGTRLRFSRPGAASADAVVREKNKEGHFRLEFAGPGNILLALKELGEVPLPPYIDRAARPEDAERYQTVYARVDGSVAAPTAGLHLSPELLARLRESGVEISYVTLHVGPGTFAPVKTERLEDHSMHAETFFLPRETAEAIRRAKAEKRRVVAVGTTTVRVLESAARQSGLSAQSGRTQIFIHPPFNFQVVDALLTNFHLPRSTLLMLVCAFAAPGATSGRDLILSAYGEAIRNRYRFFSYGDAMLIQ